MKRILTSLLMAAALSAPALAADIAPAYKAPAYTPAANWTGLYLGINGGGGILNGEISDPDDFFEAESTKFQAGFGTFGGQLGFNWQLNNFVLGLEGDLNWASAKKSEGVNLDDGTFNQGTSTLKMDAFGSVRGRAGLAVDHTLIYVTGGPAWGHFNSSDIHDGGFVVANDHEWRVGLAAGAGVEYMLTSNWIIRGEYMFLDFLDSSKPILVDGVPSDCTSNGGPCRIKFANTANVVRAGISYKFW
jgi:outer membrane immunogenic protein